MGKIDLYRTVIQEVIKQHGRVKPAFGEVELQTIFDTERDHYQLVHAGWNRNHRKYGCLMHLDIKEGKIWIQHDGTEIGVANELVELGVPKKTSYWRITPLIKDHIPGLRWHSSESKSRTA